MPVSPSTYVVGGHHSGQQRISRQRQTGTSQLAGALVPAGWDLP